MLYNAKPILQYSFSVAWIIEQACTIAFAFLQWNSIMSSGPKTTTAAWSQRAMICKMLMFTIIYSILHIEYEVAGIVALAKRHIKTLLAYSIVLSLHSTIFLLVCITLVFNGHDWQCFLKATMLLTQTAVAWFNLLRLIEAKQKLVEINANANVTDATLIDLHVLGTSQSNPLYAISSPSSAVSNSPDANRFNIIEDYA